MKKVETKWAGGEAFAEEAEALYVETKRIVAGTVDPDFPDLTIIIYTPEDYQEAYGTVLCRDADGILRNGVEPACLEGFWAEWEEMEREILGHTEDRRDNLDHEGPQA